MTFQRRLVLVVTGVAAAALLTSFLLVWNLFDAAQVRQLDEALRELAQEEAQGTLGHELKFSDRPGPIVDDVGPLHKYGAVFDSHGKVVTATPQFRAHPLEPLPRTTPGTFDCWVAGDHLRGVMVPIPLAPGKLLMLAAPREDLDRDSRRLLREMWLSAIISTALVAFSAYWIVGRVTHGHRTIVDVARQVVAGDLSARVGEQVRGRDMVQLGRNIDAMIDRLTVLLDSQKLFIAHAAHELRSPLAALYAEVTQGLRKERSAEGYREIIEGARESVRHLNALAEDLLELARLGAERERHRELVELPVVLERAVGSVAALATQKQVALLMEPPAEWPAVRGHAGELERVVRNLVENAIRHAPSHTSVRLRSVVREGALEIAVVDQGPGVPDLERPHVFNAFHRGAAARASGRGSGLGLAIARDIALDHGGDVVLDGSHTGGARFVLRLPIVSPDPAATEPSVGSSV